MTFKWDISSQDRSLRGNLCKTMLLHGIAQSEGRGSGLRLSMAVEQTLLSFHDTLSCWRSGRAAEPMPARPHTCHAAVFASASMPPAMHHRQQHVKTEGLRAEGQTGSSCHSPLAPGDVLNGRFKVESLFGEGGQCEIWQALDNEGRPVMLKVRSSHCWPDRVFDRLVQT